MWRRMANNEQAIDEVLRHSFVLMTEAALNDDAATSNVLAGMLFNYAVEMEWVEEPRYAADLAWVDTSGFDVDPGQFSIDGEQLVELGDWEVPLGYRRKFFERIRGVTATSDDEVKPPPLTFKTNPAKTIESFCTTYRLHPSTSFIKLLAPKESIDVPCPTMQRRVLRLMEQPDPRKRTSVRPNRSQWSFAELLRKTMVAYDTVRPMGDLSNNDVPPKKKFVGLTTEELLWIRCTV
jgi:hypothetical protein